MCARVALRSSLRIGLISLLGIALLPAPFVSILVSAVGQGQGQDRGRRTAPPRPGKPEGTFPDLDEVQNESRLEREPPAPIPSTIRSQRNSGRAMGRAPRWRSGTTRATRPTMAAAGKRCALMHGGECGFRHRYMRINSSRIFSISP